MKNTQVPSPTDIVHKFNDEVVKPLNTPENRAWGLFDLAWQLKINYPERDCAATLVFCDHGYGIGIADRNLKGYTPTPVFFDESVAYEEINEICDKFNTIVLGLTPDEALDIVVSTFSTSK